MQALVTASDAALGLQELRLPRHDDEPLSEGEQRLRQLFDRDALDDYIVAAGGGQPRV